MTFGHAGAAGAGDFVLGGDVGQEASGAQRVTPVGLAAGRRDERFSIFLLRSRYPV